MHRIDTTTKATDLFGAGKHGYTNGDPGTGVAATTLDAAALNAIQEEIATLIEAYGATLVKGSNGQLRTAILALLASGTHPVTPSTLSFPSTPALATRIVANTPDTTSRTLIAQSGIGSGFLTLRQYALPASTQTGMSTTPPAYELTVNARWTGTQWARDVTDHASYRLTVGPCCRLDVQIAATWSEAQWVLVADLNANGLSLGTGSLIEYQTLPTRYTVVPAFAFVYDGGYTQTTGYVEMTTNAATAYHMLRLPQGAHVTGVQFATDPAARASGYMQGALVRTGHAHAFDTQVIAYAVEDGTGNAQMITPPTFDEVVDNAAYGYSLWLRAGSDAGTNPDRFYSARVTWTDPGPRNH